MRLFSAGEDVYDSGNSDTNKISSCMVFLAQSFSGSSHELQPDSLSLLPLFQPRRICHHVFVENNGGGGGNFLLSESIF